MGCMTRQFDLSQCSTLFRLAYKFSSESAKRDRAPCLETQLSELEQGSDPFNEKQAGNIEKSIPS